MKKNLITLFVAFLILLSSCSSHKQVTSNAEPEYFNQQYQNKRKKKQDDKERVLNTVGLTFMTIMLGLLIDDITDNESN